MKRLRFLTLLCFVAALLALYGCNFGGASAGDPQEGVTYSRLLSFANEERLEEHWRKHGLNRQEFNPTLTKEEYLKKAREFFGSTASEILLKNRSNGDMLRYRPSTNEFGVRTDKGVIRTYFRPNNGMRYWERQ